MSKVEPPKDIIEDILVRAIGYASATYVWPEDQNFDGWQSMFLHLPKIEQISFCLDALAGITAETSKIVSNEIVINYQCPYGYHTHKTVGELISHHKDLSQRCKAFTALKVSINHLCNSVGIPTHDELNQDIEISERVRLMREMIWIGDEILANVKGDDDLDSDLVLREHILNVCRSEPRASCDRIAFLIHRRNPQYTNTILPPPSGNSRDGEFLKYKEGGYYWARWKSCVRAELAKMRRDGVINFDKPGMVYFYSLPT